MKSKNPIARAISAQFQSHGIVWNGSLHAFDFSDGAKEHRVEGYFYDASGRNFKFKGELSGLSFVPTKKGRPSKGNRDVAVYLAFEWFKSWQKSISNEAKREAKARELVLEHWSARGWGGMPDESARNGLIRKGRAAVLEAMPNPGFRLAFKGNDEESGSMLVLPFEAVLHASAHSGDFSGTWTGWRWSTGEETAVYEELRINLSITEP